MKLIKSTGQIVFTWRIVQKQMTIPLSLVSLILIYQNSNSFGSPPLSEMPSSAIPLATKLTNIRSIYAIDNVKNRVVDGLEPFPEDRQSLRSGISIEFRLIVHFIYPGISEACKPGMCRSSTLAQSGMLSEMYHSRSKRVDFA